MACGGLSCEVSKGRHWGDMVLMSRELVYMRPGYHFEPNILRQWAYDSFNLYTSHLPKLYLM